MSASCTNLDALYECMSEGVQRIYGSPSAFNSAFQSNESAVFRRLLGVLKDSKLPIPHDFKATIRDWVKEAATSMADEKGSA